MTTNRINRGTILIVTALALLLATPALLTAQPGGGEGRMGPHGPGGPFAHRGGGFLSERMMDRLGLDGEQRDRVSAVLETYRPEMEAAHEQMQAVRAGLRDQIHADVFDEGAIRAAAVELGRMEAEIAITRARVFHEVAALLTPEQKAQLRQVSEAMETLRQFHGPRFGGPRPGGPGPGGPRGPRADLED